MEKVILTTRPRNVNTWRAAAILYGDWGTSKAYVLGLAFALAGYASFWYILAVGILTFLVGISYIFICKAYPSGGGVYTSVRSRSKVLALVGAFFLISDYLVTIALSAVSAFHYLGMPSPEYWAIASIGLIGIMNFLGAKHSGSFAVVLAIPAVLVIISLGAMALPFLPEAIHKLQPITLNLSKDWNILIGIIIALSGIESIANTTSSMKLDPGSTLENPTVTKTSTPAIIMVMLEVCIFTTLLGLAMNALPGLEISGDDVNAPGYPNVRDAMLRYMGDVFGTHLFGPFIGHFFAYVIMIVIALLLLSAVNTALIALISLLFIMSKDEEIPQPFQILNRFGDPIYATLLAFSLPMGILLFVHDIAGLASLYAIGFVGAIAVNLVSTSTNFQLPLNKLQRGIMLVTFVIMALVEISLFIDKPHARVFVVTLMSLGLLMRALVAEKKENALLLKNRAPLPKIPDNLNGGFMVAVTGKDKALDYAIEEVKIKGVPLFVLFIREQRIITERDNNREWGTDVMASEVFDYVITKCPNHPMEFLYAISNQASHSIIEIAKQKKVNHILMNRKRKSFNLFHMLRETTVREVSSLLPQNMDLIIIV